MTSGEGDPCDVFVGESKDKVECDDCGWEGPEGEEHSCVQEGDYTTSDHRKFYQFGKLVVEVGEEGDWEVAVKAHMELEKFFPNVWLGLTTAICVACLWRTAMNSEKEKTFRVKVLVVPPNFQIELGLAKVRYEWRVIKGKTLAEAKRKAGIQ